MQRTRSRSMARVASPAAASKARAGWSRWPSARQSSLAVPAGTGQSTASGSLRRPDGSSRPFRVSFTVPSPPTATKRRAPSASAVRARCVAWPGASVKRGSKGPSRADEFGLDRGPTPGGAAFMGGGIDDHRDLRPFRSCSFHTARNWQGMVVGSPRVTCATSSGPYPSPAPPSPSGERRGARRGDRRVAAHALPRHRHPARPTARISMARPASATCCGRASCCRR